MAQTSRRHSGWHLPVAPLCAASMANQQQARTATLEELFKAEPDRLSRLSFEVAGLYFGFIEDAPRRACGRAVPRPGRGNGLRCSPRRLVFGMWSTSAKAVRRPMLQSEGAARRKMWTSRPRGGCDTCTGERGRSGCVRRGYWRASHRDRRVGPGPRCWSTRSASVRRKWRCVSCRTSTERRSTLRYGRSIRRQPSSSSRRKTFTTLETLRQIRAARNGCRMPGVADPEGRLIAVTAAPDKRRSKPESTIRASSRSARGSAGAIPCGARSE